jgi:hypothetical protein
MVRGVVVLALEVAEEEEAAAGTGVAAFFGLAVRLAVVFGAGFAFVGLYGALKNILQ